MTELDKQFQYFLDNQNKLVKKYEGKIVVIHDGSVEAAFDTNLEAYFFGKKNFEPGTFLLQKCVKGPEAYTARVSSFRVAY